MALEETEIIDQILPRNEEHRVALVIADSGAIADPKLRLNLLKKKFEHYLEAAVEGCVHPSHRYTDPNDFYIEVVCARRPTEQMLKIDCVAREGDTKHRLRVLYKELREGIWNESPAPEPVVPLENVATDSLDAIIAAAFDVGHDSLRAGEAPLFLLFVKDAQAFLLRMREIHSDEDVTSALATWASQNAAGVSVCVLLRFSRRRIDARTTNALVARVLQAQAAEGFVLAQELYGDNGMYHGSGRFLFLGCCENSLINC